MKGYYPAKVINNVDIKQQGRVQIKIEHLHYNFTPPMLPWARQSSLSTGGSALYGSSSIPEIDSYVWVWFEDVDVFMKTPYYMADIQFAGSHPHGLFGTNVASSLGSTSVYPNTKYTYYANGICIGVDSSAGNPEIFIYHPSAHIFINSLGIIEFKGGSTATQFSVLGETLQTVLGKLVDGILALTVICAAPTVASSVPVNAATFTAIKTVDLPSLLSTTIKNN